MGNKNIFSVPVASPSLEGDSEKIILGNIRDTFGLRGSHYCEIEDFKSAFLEFISMHKIGNSMISGYKCLECICFIETVNCNYDYKNEILSWFYECLKMSNIPSNGVSKGTWSGREDYRDRIIFIQSQCLNLKKEDKVDLIIKSIKKYHSQNINS